MWGKRPTAPPLTTDDAVDAPEVGVDDMEEGRSGGRGGAPEGEDTGGGEGDEDEDAPTAGLGVPNPAMSDGQGNDGGLRPIVFNHG